MVTFKLPTREEEDQRLAEVGSKVWPVIPEHEICNVELEDISLKRKPVEWGPFEEGDDHQVEFKFRVIDGPYKGSRVWGNTPTYFSFSPKCKLRIWVQSLLAERELPPGFEVDFDFLKGRQARILVGNRVSKKTGKTSHFAQDVIPPADAPDNPF